VKTKKADGTWDIHGKTDDGTEWSDTCAFYMSDGVKSSSREFTYKHNIGEGFPSWDIYNLRFNEAGSLIQYSKDYKNFMKVYPGAPILFGVEKEKYIFNKLHNK